VLKAVDEAYGIVRGHVETVHSFTNDQNLIDNFHSGDRRGRSAVLNMVITETGAARAVARAARAGRQAHRVRDPRAYPDVSLAVLHLTLERPPRRPRSTLPAPRVAALELRQQIDYVESPEVVSTDFVGSHRAGIVDGLATIANGTDVILYVWYDNEFGYSSQVIRVLEVMAGSTRSCSRCAARSRCRAERSHRAAPPCGVRPRCQASARGSSGGTPRLRGGRPESGVPGPRLGTRGCTS
jgi:glyceraldehyde 3-phosphate dehydrogenase